MLYKAVKNTKKDKKDKTYKKEALPLMGILFFSNYVIYVVIHISEHRLYIKT